MKVGVRHVETMVELRAGVEGIRYINERSYNQRKTSRLCVCVCVFLKEGSRSAQTPPAEYVLLWQNN